MSARAIEQPARDGGAVDILISVLASATTGVAVAASMHGWPRVAERPIVFVGFLVLTAVLQAMAVDVYGRGAITVSGIGQLAVGFMFGIAPAIAAAVLSAVIQAMRARSPIHRAIFNASNFALAAAGGTAAYALLGGHPDPSLERMLPALAAGVVLWAINIGVLSGTMALAYGENVLAVWRERYRWVTGHYISYGPLAFAVVVAFERIGISGLLAFALPPALLMLSVRQYMHRTRDAVEEVRQANEELQRANAELAIRNQDLRELFDFAGGLAAQTHDRGALLAHAELALTRLAGTRARVIPGLGSTAGGETLLAGGHPLGSVHLDGGDGFDAARWQRLREAVLPQLATALESAELVERLRKTHLETIAALSRSMEAKDYYTGGHTERVATVAVALAGRLGFKGHDLDAIEIGALLHDIGKIGIPERILHKPGPLDDEEWKVMKEHPVISEYILSEVDLHPVVLQIARSSHERMDGGGYPDGLVGEAIPLAARIVLVADAFDALTSDRPYRRGRRVRDAIDELRQHTGTQLCPEVVDALELLYREEPHVLAGGELRAISAA
jgi:putative nucleotidyltransferase with HDIG domain